MVPFFGCYKNLWEPLLKLTWAWSYQQKFSDLRNFQTNSENFKPTFFVRKVRKIIKLISWIGWLIGSLEMLFKTVSYECNQKYW
jgi:hypothetical protein